MFKRFVTTPPEIFVAGGTVTFDLQGIRAHKVRIDCVFVAQIEIIGRNGSRRSFAPGVVKAVVTMPNGNDAQFVRVSHPGGWSALTEFASMHGWCMVEALEEGVEPLPLTPENLQNFRWNFHTDLDPAATSTHNIMVEGIAGFEGANEHNGRIPDILFLNTAMVWTHVAAGDPTPVTFNVQTVAMLKIPVNPVGIPEDTMSVLALAAPNQIGSWGYTFPHVPFPLRSMFRTYGAGDATPSIDLVYSHALGAPANSTSTIQIQCSGIMIP